MVLNGMRICVCVCVCVYTSIVWNQLECGYASVVHTSSSFCPHTHHTPIQGYELTGLKVDTLPKLQGSMQE